MFALLLAVAVSLYCYFIPNTYNQHSINIAHDILKIFNPKNKKRVSNILQLHLQS